MRILFVAAAYNPFSPQKGGSGQRSHLLLEALAKVAEVDVAICEEGVESDIPNCKIVYSKRTDTWYHGFRNRWRKFRRLLKPWDAYSFFPIIPEFASEMSNVIESGNYDYICTRYIETAIHGGLLKYADRLIVDVDDYPVDDMIKLSNLAKSYRSRIYYYLLSKSMKYAIDKTIAKCKFVFSPNKNICKTDHSAWLPNIPYYDAPKSIMPIAHDEPTLLFVGGLSYMPNLNGITYFLENVYPKILKEVPNIQINIIGQYPDKRYREQMEQISGVHVKGFVDDLSVAYASCDICVAPIYAGAGTNIKVAEALQMQRPCVVAPVAYRGYEMLVDGEDIIVAKNDVQYADAIVELMHDEKHRNFLAKNGYAKYQKYLSKECFADIVKKSIKTLQ